MGNSRRQTKGVSLVDFFPAPQLDGRAIVVAIVSNAGGTGKSSLAYNLIRQFDNNHSKTRGLLIDLTFSNHLSGLFGVSPEKRGGLNDLLFTFRNAFISSDFLYDLVWSKYLVALNDCIDFLPSTYKLRSHSDWSELSLAGVPLLIDSIRQEKDYDFILLDMPSDSLFSILPILAISNYILVPFMMFDPRPQIRELFDIDRIVIKLKLDRYPIEVAGIVPMAYQTRIKAHKRELIVLKQLFGKYIWPIVPDMNHQKEETIRKNLEGQSLVGYQEIYLRFMKLIQKRPKLRKSQTRKTGKRIIDLINQSEKPYTYQEIAKKLGFEKKNKGDVARRYLRALSIFMNKNIEFCEKKIARAWRGDNDVDSRMSAKDGSQVGGKDENMTKTLVQDPKDALDFLKDHGDAHDVLDDE